MLNTQQQPAKEVELINDLVFLRKLSTLKVMIVDDQRNMVKTIENMLAAICAFKRKSNSVIRAHDGEEALRILLNQPEGMKQYIDMILLDWNMPKLPGIEVARTIRRSDLPFVRNVPIIMITAESRERDVQNALYEGVDNYLLKPFLLKDLRERMNPILRKYWSGMHLKRGQTRRSEPRYTADGLKLKFELEFENGSRREAKAINISEHGARAEVSNFGEDKITHLCFPTMNSTEGFVNRIKVRPILPEIEGEPKKTTISFHFESGFESEELREKWLKWIKAAHQKEMDYRTQQV